MIVCYRGKVVCIALITKGYSHCACSSEPNLFHMEMAEEKAIELNGKTYPMLADGEYDCIILGTGLKECMLAGLLSKKGKKVQLVFSRDALGHCAR